MENKPFTASFMYTLQPPTKGHDAWYAELMAIEGVFTSGKTKEEAIENIQLVVQNHLNDNPPDIMIVHNYDPAAAMWSGKYNGCEFKMGQVIVPMVELNSSN